MGHKIQGSCIAGSCAAHPPSRERNHDMNCCPQSDRDVPSAARFHIVGAPWEQQQGLNKDEVTREYRGVALVRPLTYCPRPVRVPLPPVPPQNSLQRSRFDGKHAPQRLRQLVELQHAVLLVGS